MGRQPGYRTDQREGLSLGKLLRKGGRGCVVLAVTEQARVNQARKVCLKVHFQVCGSLRSLTRGYSSPWFLVRFLHTRGVGKVFALKAKGGTPWYAILSILTIRRIDGHPAK